MQYRFSFSGIDWILVAAALPLVCAGLSVLASFGGAAHFFVRQIFWIILALVTFFAAARVDWRFLRQTRFAFGCYLSALALLALVSVAGSVIKGAQSWFSFGVFSFQPVEIVKLALIIVLAKYFSRRHVEIKNLRHLFISGFYTLVPIALLLLQPDFGSAVIVFLIWFGMVLSSGISKKHLALVSLLGASTFAGLWFFVFTDYQRARVLTFLHPLADIQGRGYNAFQSMIAVGSGGMSGKGVGYGTQSRLQFLPEYKTDFVFAAFAEEWGLMGSLILFALYGVVLWRILAAARAGETNFETLFALGVAAFFIAHFFINVGMNIGLLPVTGVTLPFLSYGGTHLFMEFAALGMLMGMRRYRHALEKNASEHQILIDGS